MSNRLKFTNEGREEGCICSIKLISFSKSNKPYIQRQFKVGCPVHNQALDFKEEK